MGEGARRLLVCALVLLFLSVCATVTAARDDAVTIYYWGVDDDVATPDLVQDFEQIHDGRDGRPAIRVVMAQSASVNKTSNPQRLLCGIAGGDPPDVVWYDRFAVGEWASKGAFMSLEGFLERDKRERPDDAYTLREDQFFQTCWREGSYAGELFAVPTTTDNRALFYNLDLFEKHSDDLVTAGCVDPAEPDKVGPPRTWAQLERAAEILTEYDEDGELVTVGFIPAYGNAGLFLYGWLNGGEYISKDGRTCTVNSPEVVAALDFMTRAYDAMGGVQRVGVFQTSQHGEQPDPFLAGRVAMRIDTDGFTNHLANLRPDMRFGVAPPPAPDGRPRFGWSGGWSLVIPAGTKHPEEAWKFVKYMVSPRAEKVRADSSRRNARAEGNVWIPRMRGRRDTTEWLMDNYLYGDSTIHSRYKDATRLFVETMSVSRYRPVTPVTQLLSNAMNSAFDEGIYKRHDPEDSYRNAQLALDHCAAIVQNELDRIHQPKEYPELEPRVVAGSYVLFLFAAATFGFWYFNRTMKSRGYFRREFHAGYLFAMPWFVGFAVFGGGPLLFSLFMSFCEYDVFHTPKWVGLTNYINMLMHDPLFYLSLRNTLYMVIGIPLGMAVSLGIAMLLNHEIKGMAVYRTLFYLPAIVPAVAASILWGSILHPEQGVLNTTLERVGIEGPGWLSSPVWAKPALILMGLWGAGGGMIVWLAGLKGVPQHLYEAAEIDGAGPLRRFWNITVPMVSPYILFHLIMGLIGTFQVFTQAYILTQGGPVNSTLFYAYALFNNAFQYMKMGYASAMAWVLFTIILGLTALQLRLSKHWVHYETEK